MTEKPKAFDPAYIRSISERVYRAELARSAGGTDASWKDREADRMIAKDDEAGRDGRR